MWYYLIILRLVVKARGATLFAKIALIISKNYWFKNHVCIELTGIKIDRNGCPTNQIYKILLYNQKLLCSKQEIALEELQLNMILFKK